MDERENHLYLVLNSKYKGLRVKATSRKKNQRGSVYLDAETTRNNSQIFPYLNQLSNKDCNV